MSHATGTNTLVEMLFPGSTVESVGALIIHQDTPLTEIIVA